ncbi:hypothetical protein EW146_g6137 [Bondarzewia mesenterica]|uniref:C2H2-type domain-containing protein n=1 Tax=Bondarzewia mesenterica TaxID=1095465 RepID=A0A4S4LPF5_9AGAM|nr:hypothetical protein EW146_g6137 [Bondarzewia mesenterica]
MPSFPHVLQASQGCLPRISIGHIFSSRDFGRGANGVYARSEYTTITNFNAIVGAHYPTELNFGNAAYISSSHPPVPNVGLLPSHTFGTPNYVLPNGIPYDPRASRYNHQGQYVPQLLPSTVASVRADTRVEFTVAAPLLPAARRVFIPYDPVTRKFNTAMVTQNGTIDVDADGPPPTSGIIECDGDGGKESDKNQNSENEEDELMSDGEADPKAAGGSTEHRCILCDKTFASHRGLQLHEMSAKAHSLFRFFCGCGGSYTRSSSLRRHLPCPAFQESDLIPRRLTPEERAAELERRAKLVRKAEFRKTGRLKKEERRKNIIEWRNVMKLDETANSDEAYVEHSSALEKGKEAKELGKEEDYDEMTDLDLWFAEQAS